MSDDWFDNLWKGKSDPPKPPSDPPVNPLNGDDADRYVQRAIDLELAAIANAWEGARNDQLNTSAFNLGTFVGAGQLDYGSIAGALEAAGYAVGLDKGEVPKTVASGLKAGMGKPRRMPEARRRNDAPRPPPPTPPPEDFAEAPERVVDESTFWEARLVLSTIHALARARRVSPWAVLGVVLARVIAATPYYLALPPIVGGEASLNTFIGLVGRSGAGKGAASAVAARAINVQTGHPFKTVKTGSGEGIAHGYMKNVKGIAVQHEWQVLFDVPEIDTLTALGNRQGATLMPELRSGWSGEAMGFAYADPNKRLPVPGHSYRMCLVAGIQPKRAAGLLGDSDAGTPQRFIWLPAIDSQAPDDAPGDPKLLTWAPPNWVRLPGVGKTEAPNGEPIQTMPVCKTARDLIVVSALSRLRGTGDALDGHGLLARLKVAAAFSLLEGRVDIDDEDWELSGVVAAKSNETRGGVEAALADVARQSNMGKAKAEADRTIIVGDAVEAAAVRRAGVAIIKKLTREGGWVTGADLRRVLSAAIRPQFDTAIESLMEVGQVESEGIVGRGLPGIQYRRVTDLS